MNDRVNHTCPNCGSPGLSMGRIWVQISESLDFVVQASCLNCNLEGRRFLTPMQLAEVLLLTNHEEENRDLNVVCDLRRFNRGVRYGSHRTELSRWTAVAKVLNDTRYLPYQWAIEMLIQFHRSAEAERRRYESFTHRWVSFLWRDILLMAGNQHLNDLQLTPGESAFFIEDTDSTFCACVAAL